MIYLLILFVVSNKPRQELENTRLRNQIKLSCNSKAAQIDSATN